MSWLKRYGIARDPAITVANLVDELLRRKGDCDVAIHEQGVFRLSELHLELCSLTGFLRNTVGLQPGQPVAIYRSNTRECFHWFLAIIRAGGIAVPLNPQLSLLEVRRILADSGTNVLVTDRAVFERTIKDRKALDVQTWIQADDTADLDGFLRVRKFSSSGTAATIDPAATIAIFHTSGTSGFPKGAALSSRALLGARASTVLAGAVFTAKDTALVALPWSHIMAVSVALFGLMAGIRGCFLERFDVDAALELIERFRITTVVGVPTMFVRLVNSRPAPARVASVRVWVSASDHLAADVRKDICSWGTFMRTFRRWRVPPILLNGYGLVELGGLAMMGVYHPWLHNSGDLYFPVPPFHIRITGEDGNKVPAGVVGECQIRRRGLAPHYWEDKGQTHDLITADGWLRTGDLATRTRLGSIRLVGRAKDVIKSGGYSVYVQELEEALLANSAVARAVAFGLPHSDKGEIPAAAVELHMGVACDEADLLAWCSGRLARYKTPQHIWIVSAGELPQNHNGKYLRRVLQEHYQHLVR